MNLYDLGQATPYLSVFPLSLVLRGASSPNQASPPQQHTLSNHFKALHTLSFQTGSHTFRCPREVGEGREQQLVLPECHGSSAAREPEFPPINGDDSHLSAAQRAK